MNIVLIGMPGCGKTTIGKILSEKLKYKFYDIDYEIEKDTNKTINDIFAHNGEEVFRNIESETIERISKEDLSVISLGGGVVLREDNILNAKRNGKVIFINRPIEDIVSDVEVEKRPLLKDGVEKIYSLYNQRIDLYKKYADVEVLNDNDLDQVIKKILEVVSHENFSSKWT